MLTSLFLSGILGVLLIPVQPQLISVCLEEDEDLRVDCRIEPKPNKINSYEFSWSSRTKEALINTNVSGSAAEAQFRDKSEVVELDPYGYRMTLKGFTNTLPHNTTYMCKISGQVESINVEKEQLQPCSAVSLFLKSSWSWIVPLLIFLFHTHC
ncbi:PREDICTED: thy-1 membrane glycoprotein-like [Poecilia mexicana]|uniref:Ig-like domain-containing protein n=1 Tax=Poecilia mexicana TaxID=48701 RepID=A0A3B3Y355_9TELE|nr:PREDICTED: thy-1 membrane glycoprotein-like [Poecilia mexicana]